MPKTTNLGIEITTDDSTLFSEWRASINGNNNDSFAKIVDVAVGELQEAVADIPDSFVAGVVEIRANLNIKFWTGTQTQYDDIVTKDDNTLYFITE